MRTDAFDFNRDPWPKWFAAALLVAAVGCAEPREPASGDAPLGAFNFTLESRPVAAQVELLDSLGYTGVTLFWPGHEAFDSYAHQPAVEAGRVHLPAVLLGLPFNTDWNREEMDGVLAALAPRRTALWLIMSGPADAKASMVASVRDVVDLATARGVDVVLYPHDGEAIENVEESLALIAAVDRPQLKTSLHLCHELRAGNRDRLEEVIEAAAPQLALVSIHGASREFNPQGPGWSDVIQPLDRGDLDVETGYLLPLRRAGYDGPVLLHTFGIEEPPEEHFRRSMLRWRELSRSVADVSSAGSPFRTVHLERNGWTPPFPPGNALLHAR
ncbi:sugar phosphate isomerase/epimerase family protein [Corallococcus aberystwythensis]|uniref:Sugar phosphate isomerase/epimerase n=1 Tax=Corallococcus aberystwythensis TaxID=2316722 RepID=A0A3A8PZX8_9BACT|nr:TIM barrel protein [Corallococcus aberystwythensis]RKH61438.1 sugar phosphate isomerase/epimerase [Corallococcus aberystwythensis]